MKDRNEKNDALKVAVVGLGTLGTRHTRVFQESPNAAVVAVVDRNPERAREVAGRFGVHEHFPDTAHMLEKVTPDVVAVATPDGEHTREVLLALEAGAHVLVEKPLATDMQEAGQIVEAARKHHRLVAVNYSQRHVSEFRWIKDRVEEGVIGKPLFVNSTKYDTLYVPTRMINWADRTSPIFFMTSHDLDLICWYLGSAPVEVYGQEVREKLTGSGIDAHDGVSAVLRFASGASALFHSSWVHPTTYPVIAGGHLEITGSKGYIHYSMLTRSAEIYTELGGQKLEFKGPHTADEVDGRITGAFVRSLEGFLSCVRDNEDSPVSAAATLHVTRSQCAVIDSIRAGRPIRVEASAR